MYTAKFWKDAVERVLATFLQTLLGVALAGPVFDVLGFDWGTALTISASAAALSLLKALVAGAGHNDSVSPASLASDKTL